MKVWERMKKINVGNRIAVMILGPLGDVINTSVVFRTLAEAYPQATLSIIATDRGVPAAVGIPEISNKYVLDTSNTGNRKKASAFKFAWSLRGKFDTVIVLDNSLRAAICAFLTCAKNRIGRGRELRELFLTDIVPYLDEEKNCKIHVSEHYARCLKPLNIYKENLDTSFVFDEEAEKVVSNLLENNNLSNKKIIGFCPACGSKRKSLFLEDSIKILKYLNSLNEYNIIIVGGNDVKDYVSKLKQEDIEFTDFSGHTTFSQTAALIDKCEKFISVDTSCMHLALARKVPTLSLFFYDSGIKWGPKNLDINRRYTNFAAKELDMDLFIEKFSEIKDKSTLV